MKDNDWADNLAESMVYLSVEHKDGYYRHARLEIDLLEHISKRLRELKKQWVNEVMAEKNINEQTFAKVDAFIGRLFNEANVNSISDEDAFTLMSTAKLLNCCLKYLQQCDPEKYNEYKLHEKLVAGEKTTLPYSCLQQIEDFAQELK